MSHSSKLTEPKERVAGTSHLQPVGQKEAPGILTGIWSAGMRGTQACLVGLSPYLTYKGSDGIRHIVWEPINQHTIDCVSKEGREAGREGGKKREKKIKRERKEKRQA